MPKSKKKRKKLASLRQPLPNDKAKRRKNSKLKEVIKTPSPIPPIPTGRQGIADIVRQLEKQYNSKVPDYLPQSLAKNIVKQVGGKCKIKHVNKFILTCRQKRRKKRNLKSAFYYFVLNKPKGYASMRENPNTTQMKYPSCYSILPKNFPAVPHVGRLDVDTEGLLLFTDDGQLLEGLINDRESTKAIAYHSKYSKKKKHGSNNLEQSTKNKGEQRERVKVEKVYLVQVTIKDDGDVDDTNDSKSLRHTNATLKASSNNNGVLHSSFLDSMRSPLKYPDGSVTRPADVHEATQDVATNATLKKVVMISGSSGSSSSSSSSSSSKTVPSFWLCVRISQGKNRQIRRLCTRAGLKVLRLLRFSVGPVQISELDPGKARSLTKEELTECYNMALPEQIVPEILPLPMNVGAWGR
jgi:16S rRNA U516 pseudouridylate synthase RsuA-like enzyme